MPEPRALATALLATALLATALLATALAAVAVGMPGAAAAAVGTRVDFRFADARISESSGLALSVRHPHTVWTVNDSGDSARVFAVDTRTGATVGVHTFDADVRDVEAIAVTPQGRMLVADIGDNGRSRAVVRLYWFDEPGLGTTSGGGVAQPSWELDYPDGSHDAEAVAVDPRTGRVLVVTKERVGGIYAVPDAPSRRGLNRLTKVGTAPSTVTDAVFLPDGSALALRTYTSLHLIDPDTFAPLASTLLPVQPQGETLATAPGAAALLVGSEGKGSRVRQVEVPAVDSASGPATSTTSAPSPSSTPTSDPPAVTATAAPAAPASSATSAGGEGRARPRVDRGELFAGLGASAGLVLLAFLVARLAGRRPR